jgi:23S rRNA (guanosine2251-2'-O)-methyltransferase
VVKGELLFGRNAVLESLRSGRRAATRLWVAEGLRQDDRVDEIIELARQAEVLLDTVPRTMLDDAAPDVNHQGVLLEAPAYPYADLADVIEAEGNVLILDHLQDPQNFGTLLRSADAAGVAGVIIPSDRSASVNPTVVNASAGAVEHLQIALVANLGNALDRLDEAGRWIVGLDGGPGSQDLFATDLPTPVALVVGSEGSGLTPNIRKRCQLVVSLPMRGQVASLNAATAGSIALFDLVRREPTA